MTFLKNSGRKPRLSCKSTALVVLCTLGGTSAWANTITVNDLADPGLSGDTLCTLREAINSASTDTAGDCVAGAGADTILFNTSGTIALTSQLTISDPVGLTLDGVGRNVILSGNYAVRVLQLNPGVNLSLRNLTVTNGLATGGSFAGGGVGGGAGINNQFGNLTIDRCTFTGNTSTGNGGGIANYGDSTAVVPNGNLVITNSTFSNNSAAFGGAILNGRGKIWASHLTVVGNNAVTPACPAGSLCTLSINEGGGIDNSILSGATLQAGIFNLENSIVAGNYNVIKRTNLPDLTSPSDIRGYVTGGNTNLIGSSAGIFSGLQNGVNGNIVGIDVNTIVNTTLANNGGPTQTMALLANSPAINTASATNCPATDQRGVARPQGTGCDIGAFEVPVSADLAVSENVSPNPVVLRDSVSWTINILNNGPADATGVKFIDILPAAGLTSITSNTTQGSCGIPTSGKITCNLGNLANGGSATITVKGITNKIATLMNTVNLSGDQPDPLLTNNTATQAVAVQALLCNGIKPTIVGTPNADNITGTKGRDIIHGLGGNDTISGGNDNDTICGGEGNDVLNGASGNDTLNGGAGTDSCNGGTGTDTATNCEASIAIP